MQIKGHAHIAAPTRLVWDALTDPVVLARLIPGCESMTGSPWQGYDITVAQGVGGMKARLAGRLDLSEVEEGRGCLIHAEGRGGAAGLAHGTGRLGFLPDGVGTRLSWDLDARLGGKLALIPGFMVRRVAERMIDGFVDRFRRDVEGAP
jgi:uncharacterized protein